MRLRFQRRVKVLPGVTLNFSKSGVSTSVGVRGARVTRGRGQTRVTVGLPGSGLSLTEVRRTPKRPAAQRRALLRDDAPQAGLRWRRSTVLWAVLLGLIFLVLATR